MFSKRVNKGDSQGPSMGSGVERTGGCPDTSLPAFYKVKAQTCWCGETVAPNKNLCTECYRRLPDLMQKALYNKGHFIDSYSQVLKRAIDWLKQNPVGGIK